MSKDSHAFSVSVACEVGVSAAIILQHLCFLQKANVSAGENWQEKWIKRSAASMAKTYPYWSPKQIRRILEHLKKSDLICSKNDQSNPNDYSNLHILTATGLAILGEKGVCPNGQRGYAQTGKGVCPNGQRGYAQTGKGVCPNGQGGMPKRANDNKVDYTSIIPSFVEKDAGAEKAPLSPPFKETGEFLNLEEKEKNLQTGAATPPPQNEVNEIAPQTPPKASGRTKQPNPRNNEPAIHPENEIIFQHFSDPERARHAWVQWIFYKHKEHHERYKGAMSEAVKLRSLFKDSGGNSEALELMIEQAIGNTWKGIFKLKDETQNGGKANGLNPAQRQHLKLAHYASETHFNAANGDGRKMEYITGEK